MLSGRPLPMTASVYLLANRVIDYFDDPHNGNTGLALRQSV